MEFLGQCLCGSVEFSISDEPLAVTRCHCDHCKKQSGSLHSINAIVRNQNFSVKGQTAVFKDVGDSGKPVLRHFCPSCGAPIVVTLDSMPGKTVVKAGSLSNLDHLSPTLEIYTGKAPDWVSLLPDAKEFSGPPI